MYKIIRHFQNGDREDIKGGLTLVEAREHCQDPETSSKTCTTEEGQDLTDEHGPWFDSYDEE